VAIRDNFFTWGLTLRLIDPEGFIWQQSNKPENFDRWGRLYDSARNFRIADDAPRMLSMSALSC
jgi:hypothetical protein